MSQESENELKKGARRSAPLGEGLKEADKLFAACEEP